LLRRMRGFQCSSSRSDQDSHVFYRRFEVSLNRSSGERYVLFTWPQIRHDARYNDGSRNGQNLNGNG